MQTMLEVCVSKRRGAFVLQASFAAPVPGITALFGRSGSGKTTLVNIISGLLRPEQGQVRLGTEVLTDVQANVHVPPERRRIGYVFQDPRLFPHLTVGGNLRYGARRTRSPLVIGFDDVVSLLGLAELLARKPRQLSGGERQRVSLGRALLSQPRLLLLDEPLASVDAERREEVLPYLEALRDRLSIPMVYVSHQFDEVLRLATHLVLLERGRVSAQGSLQEMCLRTELQSIVGPEFVGAVLEGTVSSVDSATGSARVAIGAGSLQVALGTLVVGERVRLQLLARDVILSAEPAPRLSVRNVLAATTVDLSEDAYGAVLVRCDVGGAIVLARITPEARAALQLERGRPVWVLIKAVLLGSHAYRLAGPN
jgi:molybdate transport system ATP-binding protein